MAKLKTVYFCANCGADFPKWAGRCGACGEWNTLREEQVSKQPAQMVRKSFAPESPALRNITEINSGNSKRLVFKDLELNRTLGGGAIPGSIVLLGGEPGIGKSTLLLQLALQNQIKVVYVSGEESEEQLKMRASRIGISNAECFILTETNAEKVLGILQKNQPELVVIDSIQTIFSDLVESAPGSISQIRETTAMFLRYAKETNVPVFLIGHITKDGQIAGPKLLEHMVDTVLQFEGDRHNTYRMVRTLKNRFGSTSELGIYEMMPEGLRQVSNPSEILISQRDEILSGISITATIEGARPLLIETQALVSPAVYGTPQRVSTGFDARRLNMLLAVLEKRCGFRLTGNDVFVNIAGGIKIDDPGMDLGITSAILSSYHNVALDPTIVFAGEVGLSGEVRSVSRVDQRIAEAVKLGFKQIMISKYNKGKFPPKEKSGIDVIQIGTLDEMAERLFG